MRNGTDYPSSIVLEQDVFSDRSPFMGWVGDRLRLEKFKRMIEEAGLSDRFNSLRRTMSPLAAARLTLRWRDEDRQGARLGGPLVLVDGKVRYVPFPGERTFPGDLILEELGEAEAA